MGTHKRVTCELAAKKKCKAAMSWHLLAHGFSSMSTTHLAVEEDCLAVGGGTLGGVGHNRLHCRLTRWSRVEMLARARRQVSACSLMATTPQQLWLRRLLLLL